MTIRKPGDELLEIVVLPKRMPEIGENVEEKRVATYIAKMFAKQIGRSLHIAGGRGAEDLDVVAFPVHLPATVTSDRDSGSGIEIGEGKLESRIGIDGEAQRFGGSTPVDGSLCLPVEGRGPRGCGDRAAMVLNGPRGIHVIMPAEGRALPWLHESYVGLEP